MHHHSQPDAFTTFFGGFVAFVVSLFNLLKTAMPTDLELARELILAAISGGIGSFVAFFVGWALRSIRNYILEKIHERHQRNY